ncbi:hypothetical protein A2U01_0101547, partial [Trifolium medium]|nr:hypothetical protein [Trifolium medium]
MRRTILMPFLDFDMRSTAGWCRDVYLYTQKRSMLRCSMSLPCQARIGSTTDRGDVHAYSLQ